MKPTTRELAKRTHNFTNHDQKTKTLQKQARKWDFSEWTDEDWEMYFDMVSPYRSSWGNQDSILKEVTAALTNNTEEEHTP